MDFAVVEASVDGRGTSSTPPARPQAMVRIAMPDAADTAFLPRPAASSS
jgi:hypothetical protein